MTVPNENVTKSSDLPIRDLFALTAFTVLLSQNIMNETEKPTTYNKDLGGLAYRYADDLIHARGGE
jgi:hypothetical protein